MAFITVPHSKALGQLTWKLKENIEQVFLSNMENIKQNKTSDIWSEDEIQTVKGAVNVAWLNARKQIIHFFKGQYTNWNPCYTSSSEITGEYKQPDISTIRLSNLIDTALHTGDFSNINQLYCNIVSTHCRHNTDYCYLEKKIKDKVHSAGGKFVSKNIVTCKRRKPQPTRGFPAIYADPHDQKYYQLSYECNDEWFNGADPFMILNNLGNCDCKALIPSIFTRQPKYEFSENDHDATMSMYMDVGDGAVEYVIKYIAKSSIPLRTDREIFSKISQTMEHVLTESGIYQCYAQAATQGCVPLFTAQHVNLGIPQVMRNTNCSRINVLGRKTLRKFQQPQNSNDSYLNENHIDKFEARFTLSDRITVSNDEVCQPMSMHTFFDKYKVSFDKHKKLIVHTRQRERNGVYQSIRLTPHTTIIQANPTRNYYGEFCKKICLWAKAFGTIRETVRKFTRDEKKRKMSIGSMSSILPFLVGMV